jgi:hypothetical protein
MGVPPPRLKVPTICPASLMPSAKEYTEPGGPMEKKSNLLANAGAVVAKPTNRTNPAVIARGLSTILPPLQSLQ